MCYNKESQKLDKSVKLFIQLDDETKKAYHLFIAGLTYSIYSDSDCCALYAKKKMMKLKAIDYL